MVHGANRVAPLAAWAAGALALFSTLTAVAEAQPSTRSVAQVERDRRAAEAQAAERAADAEAARANVQALQARLTAISSRAALTETTARAVQSRAEQLIAETLAAQSAYAIERDALAGLVIRAAFTERTARPDHGRAGLLAAAIAPTYESRITAARKRLDAAKRGIQDTNEAARLLEDARADIESERETVQTMLARRNAASAQLTAQAERARARARQFAAEAYDLQELANRASRSRRASGVAANRLPRTWLAPVAGQIVHRFGEREGAAPPASGITVRTAPGAPVVAPTGGEIAYAGLFRSYGNVLILNLDDGYALVLAGLRDVRVQAGETAAAGAAIAIMPDASAPELYVELRRNGTPVDPGPWLNANALAAERRNGSAG